MSNWTIWRNLGLGVTFTVTCGSQLLIFFFQLLACVAVNLAILNVVFVISGHIECQTGQFEAIWDGL